MLPTDLSAVRVPPIKCQGIKTRLVPFLARNLCWSGHGRWVEPFLGSGVVAFNLAPERARLSDSNPHVVAFYRAIQAGRITSLLVRERLTAQDRQLREQGEKFYYQVRERFNDQADPLDLLFLNRSCFNGMLRFNRRGHYNVPFGKKPQRFRPAYITKIVRQVEWVERLLQAHPAWQIACCDWRQALADVEQNDFVYVDPPYVGRHADYFNRWTDDDARQLAEFCRQLPCGYALSMWQANRFRTNGHLDEHWAGHVVRTFSHFYHLGPQEARRHPMVEALLIRPGWQSAAGEPVTTCDANAAADPPAVLESPERRV